VLGPLRSARRYRWPKTSGLSLPLRRTEEPAVFVVLNETERHRLGPSAAALAALCGQDKSANCHRWRRRTNVWRRRTSHTRGAERLRSENPPPASHLRGHPQRWRNEMAYPQDREATPSTPFLLVRTSRSTAPTSPVGATPNIWPFGNHWKRAIELCRCRYSFAGRPGEGTPLAGGSCGQLNTRALTGSSVGSCDVSDI
jgi:hypothetical protein